MIDSVVRALITQKATIEPQKAVTGPGAAVMSWGIPISDVTRNSQQMMREAQAVYSRGNRWVKRAEMVISNRVGGVPWHLETDDGETVDDESDPQLRAYRDLFEKPIDTDFSRQYPTQPSTRRSLWGVTSRHMGLCNIGFWHLDEIDAAVGWPRRLFSVRPDRITPHEVNGRFVNWVLDADSQGGGLGLSSEELLPFYLDQPDKGYFGTGLVESVFSSLGLPSAIDRHALDTLGSGGRLPGVYSPKEQTGDDVFDRLVSDLRTIKDMPDSAKRDVVARAPIEFTPTAADMSSLVVTALATMSRDDTLIHWGVPIETIGGTAPAGLNSGGARDAAEAALWQNAVGFRIDGLWETIQYRLLDRLQGIGVNLRLVIEEPAFDDDAPRYEMASNATNLPLTNDERRALVGLPPLGGNLGREVRLPMTIQPIGAVEEEEDASGEVEAAKASLNLRPAIDKLTPKLKRDVAAFLDMQKRTIVSKVRANAAHLAKKPTDSQKWWSDEWDAKLQKVLAPYANEIANLTAERTSQALKPAGKAAFTDLAGNRVLQRLLSRLGTRIKGINETTREKIAAAIKEGVEAGDGAAQLGDRVEAAAAFDEYRAELIARTESARVLNESQIESFREFGVGKVRAIDGDDDPECAERNGQEFDLDDALDVSDHPNGTLDWSPVVA
jgi:SPP1 gp7 family putative phage head morphogenesis protein